MSQVILKTVERKGTLPRSAIRKAIETTMDLKPIPEPVGSFVIDFSYKGSNPPVQTQNGMYYHYSQVVTMMGKYTEKKMREADKAEEKKVMKLLYDQHRQRMLFSGQTNHQLMNKNWRDYCKANDLPFYDFYNH